MHVRLRLRKLTLATLVVFTIFVAVQVSGADMKGQVMGGGAPVAQSTVTLWAASAGAPEQLAQTKTDNEGRFEVRSAGAPADSSLYLVATGGEPKARGGGNNSAIALLAVVGSKPPARVVINEFTTIASVWTHAQFIDGMTIKGAPLQLRIAAGNVPNFVDLETGGYGATIADALNSTQSPTLANFGTLADVIAGCVTRVQADACNSLFEAARPPSGGLPTDTLNTAESIALYPWHQPDKVFALLAKLYPIPQGKRELRPAPFMPYLTFAPSAWVLPLRFAGGGLSAGGKLMIDSEGNIWTADNFQVGAQAQDT